MNAGWWLLSSSLSGFRWLWSASNCLSQLEGKETLKKSWKQLAEMKNGLDELQADLEFTFDYLKKIENSNKVDLQKCQSCSVRYPQ